MNNNLNKDAMVSPPPSSSSSSSLSIKAEAVVSSSSSNITARNSTTVVAATGMDIRSVKEEEEKDAFVENHHDDDGDDEQSRKVQVLQVKKDGNPDKETKSNSDDDNDYSDWKAGNWCWVLPANKDNDNISNKHISNETQQQFESQNNKNRNRRRCMKTEGGDNGNINSDEGDEALSFAPPKKKKRQCRKLYSYTNTISSIKQEEYSIDNDASFVASSVNHNNNNDDEDKDEDDDEHNNAMEQGSTNNNEHENEGCDDGYESWTEGNWCWIIPLTNCDADGKSKHQPSSEVVPVTNEASNTTLTRSSRHRPSSNQLHKSPKKTKSTTTYTKSYNKRWHEMFRRLVAYKKKFKSTSVPSRYGGDPKLGNWAEKQRTNYKNNMIAENRVDLLNSVGFVLETYEKIPWDEMFQRLVRYKEEHNTTVVPQKKNKANSRLGNWVGDQRTYYKYKELSVERINRLDSIDFVWNPRDAKWMEMYQKLLAYKNQHRSTKVPRCYMEDPQLGQWVSHQQQVNNKTTSGILSKKRLGLLNSINFDWSAR